MNKAISNKHSKRNNTIDFLRLICAFLVISIHTRPMYELNGFVGYLSTEIIPRVAVPFFFCVSGFYYIDKLLKSNIEEYKVIFIETIKNLLFIYSIWTFIYYIRDFIIFAYNKNSIGKFIYICIKNYFIFGSNYQLWYFPALIFCICIVTIFFKYGKLKYLAYLTILLYVMGLLGSSYFEIGIKIPILSELIYFKYFTLIRRVLFMALPFFTLGYFLNLQQISKINHKVLNNKILICFFYFLLKLLLLIFLI